MPNWVELSSIVVPKTYKLLKNIEILSARKTYKHVSDNSMKWKMLAFRDIIDREFQCPTLMNVISIGDAEYEYQALISLNDVKKNHHKYLKSVKFLKAPTHDILVDQLNVLNSAIPYIWIKEQHLDLKLDFYSKIKR